MTDTVRQQRMDEDVFMQKRKEVLAIWPTGKEVDLEEAVEYQRLCPTASDSTRCCSAHTTRVG